ncbi:MAG: tetratricopeptide repeat protein [Reichenbachiella sp.]
MRRFFLFICTIAIFTSCNFFHKTSFSDEYVKAADLYKVGNYFASLRMTLEVVKEAEFINDFDLMGNAYYLMAYNYKYLYHPDSALLALKKAQTAYWQSGDKIQEANVVGEMGTVFLENFAYQIAKEYYSDFSRRAEALDDDRLMAESYNNIGQALLKMHDYLEAYSYFSQALKIELSLDDKPKYVADIYLAQGLCQFEEGNYRIASDLFWKALGIGRKHKLIKIRGKANNHIAECKMMKEDFDTAEKHFNLALNLLKDYPTERTISYVGLGNIYLKRGNINRAIASYFTATEGNLLAIDFDDVQEATDSLSVYYENQGKIDSALYFSRKGRLFSKRKEAQKSLIKKADNTQYAISVMHEQGIFDDNQVKKQQESILLWSVVILSFLLIIIGTVKNYLDRYSQISSPVLASENTGELEQKIIEERNYLD